MSPRSAICFLGLFAALAGGCDTLQARHRAQLGAELYKKGDFQNALYKYEQAAALDSGIDALHLNLGFVYLQLFNASPKSTTGAAYGGLAVRSFQEYHRRRADDPRARSYLVQTFVDTRRYDDAVAFFKPEVEAPKPSIEAISTLGQIAARVGKIQDALTWYEKRVEITPTDPDAHYNLGVLVWDLLHNHLEIIADARLNLANRGLQALNKAIELRPHSPDGYTYLNLVYRERATGQPDDLLKAADIAEADKYMKQALELMKQGGAKK